MEKTDLEKSSYSASEFLAAGFDAVVPCRVDLGNGYLVDCVESLRVLPGKRHVFQALCKGNQKVIKLVADAKRASKQSNAEAMGLGLLSKGGILCPQVTNLEIGKAFGFIELEYLENAHNFMDVWLEELSQNERRSLLKQLMGVIAKLHDLGLTQSDIHLDNFMIKDDAIYVIDGATVVSLNDQGGLQEKQSLENLSLFFAQFYTRYEDFFQHAYDEYRDVRDMEFQATWGEVKKLLYSERQKRLGRYQKKVFRTSTAHICLRGKNSVAICDREFYSEEVRKLLEDPDQYIAHAGKLKEGNSATVVRLAVDGVDCVLKRYNIKSQWHWLKRQFGKTRAEISWQAAYLFNMIGLITPRPLAIIQKKRGIFRQEAYYLCESVSEGCIPLNQIIDNGLSEQEGLSLFEPVFTSLRRARMSHGDLKATNFFVRGGQVIIIDLDAVARHKNLKNAEKAILKDRERFSKNWR